MAERSFAEEVGDLKLGAGAVFRGEGILAVTKALLQSGVSYVGGYQGAPISHLMDVLADAQEILGDLGVHFEASASEAAAAAMLAASVNYPLRGAVTWKSTVGTNVASDALSQLASSGVRGGALVIIGEDYGEGSSIMQERSHAFAMKAQMWLLDPRPNLPSIVNAVERGFELSEASNTPVFLELRIRACHVYGSFVAKDNRRPAFSLKDAMENPARDYGRIVLPPSNFVHEIEKVEKRWPAAIAYIKAHRLNEHLGAASGDVGIIVQGGLYNTLNRALELAGLSDAFGEAKLPIYCLNVAYPLIDDEVRGFCLDKKAVLLIEEGQPDYIEQSVNSILKNADIQTKIVGKAVLPRAGEYTSAVILGGLRKFLADHAPRLAQPGEARGTPAADETKTSVASIVPQRPAGFCTGCPERPVFSAMKLVEKEIGRFHVSCDIGCHLFSILPPFDIGNTTMGYGLGWAGASAFGAEAKQRTVAVMGDGGFWHNGLTSGVGNAVFNKSDNVLIIIDNGYSAATGGQDILSSRAGNKTKSTNNPISAAVRGVGVKWVEEVHTYDIGRMKRVLKDAMTTAVKGPKVIIAQAECMLNRQRREKPLRDKAIREGKRVVRARYGVDPDTCTGDHSCIRLSGCPSLTIRDNPDPLRDDPVAWVNNDCVGCGVCGENAHAAILCPSFYRAELIYNPSLWDRIVAGVRATAIGWMQGGNWDSGMGNPEQGMENQEAQGGLEFRPRRAAALRHHSPLPIPDPRPLKIAVMALGGQGGGVLAEWIVKAGERAGFIAQSTSVPGVAQRTGATVYYVELFPKSAADAKGAAPILALMPAPGDVDVVIAAELMEAGRALARGFLSDKTTLIASSHRVYAIGEKIAMGDGRQDSATILDATKRAAGRFIAFDMERESEEAGAVISAVMLGALAGSGATPIARETFEETIRTAGRAVERNLKGFAAGFAAALSGVATSAVPARPPAISGERPATASAPLLARIDRLPESARSTALLGLKKVVDFQDPAYGALYLDELERFQKIDAASGGAARHHRLSKDVAKYLALAMAYDDVIRVADLKTRASRFARFREDVRAADGQIVRVFEYMHPRVEEACDLLPAPLAKAILNSGAARRVFGVILGKGRCVATTNLAGFVLLKALASLRFMRPAGSRYAKEQARIGSWLRLIESAAAKDYAFACEIAGLQRLIKGYGETHQRGLANYEKIAASLDRVAAEPAPAAALARLKDCALKDESGAALDAALARLGAKAAA